MPPKCFAASLLGLSRSPACHLYVTAAGMAVDDAAGVVSEMAGRFRLPDALKLVDRLARGIELPDAVGP